MQTLCVYMSISLSSSTHAPLISTQKKGVFESVLFGINDFFSSSPPDALEILNEYLQFAGTPQIDMVSEQILGQLRCT